MIKITIFASGSGSNAESIMDYFQNHTNVQVIAIFTNNPKAGVLERANRFAIPTFIFNRHEFFETNDVLDKLHELKTDIIALAGFLWFVPENISSAFTTVNIHPALLPKYGGKGMHGMNVHRAVKAAGEKKSGMTIHYVNNRYDEGEIIFQESVDILPSDSPEDIAAKVLTLEHKNYPIVLEKLAENGDKI